MNIRSALRRWLSPAGFALIGICFLLPFATVSCDGARTTFTGMQLVTHTVPRGGVPAYDQNADQPCTEDIGICVEQRASGHARFALAAALVGLLLGLLGIARGPGWCAAAGLVSTLLLGFDGFSVMGGPDVRYLVGYDLVLWLFLAQAILHLVLAVQRFRERRRRPIAHAPAPSRASARVAVHPHHGGARPCPLCARANGVAGASIRATRQEVYR